MNRVDRLSQIGPWPNLTSSLGLRHFLCGAWILTMISIPIVRWLIGDGALHRGVTAGVLLQVATVLAILWHSWGGRETVRVAALVVPFAWLIERIGSTTGVPFGAYQYTDALAPLFAGVPLVIPLAWLMMLPPSWAMAYAITGRWQGWRFVLVSALAFTAWDLFLDPQMVAWGYWVWDQPGVYFGIPFTNYVGWILSAALLTFVVRPQQKPVMALAIVYIITWLLQSIGQFAFWQMPGPALTGFVGMGAFVFFTVRATLGKRVLRKQTEVLI